jgi:hypothetical protein
LAGSPVDTNPQPYVEVAPGDSGYADAVNAADLRLSILHSGTNPAVPIEPTQGVTFSRYNDPGQTDDIEDPAVAADPVCHPIPVGSPSNIYPFAEHPDWVITDLSQSPPPWVPRRSDWADILVSLKPPPPPSVTSACPGNSTQSQDDAFADQQTAIGLLQSATLDQVRPYATTLVPFGLWQEQSGCNLSSEPTVQSIPAAAAASGQPPPNWIDVTDPAPSAHVYRETPGAAVFRMICINCHGPLADANGRLAQNLATMTGGFARVADFRDGLFGPSGAPEGASNRHAVFGSLPAGAPANWTGISDEDRAGRYMPWMALGGTLVTIPSQILELVGASPVFGERRALSSGHLSANMLSVAKALCLSLLGPTEANEPLTFDPSAGGYLVSAPHLGVETPKANYQLLAGNGDAELWLSMCSVSNPPPVHILLIAPGATPTLTMRAAFGEDGTPIADWANGMVPWASYPTGAPIGNEHGQTVTFDPAMDSTGSQPANEWPWCVNDTTGLAAENHLPVCPPCVLSTTTDCAGAAVPPGSSRYLNVADGTTWAVRGAINAGMSVYLYVESLLGLVPGPDYPEDYTQCQLLH